ncbi:IDEAL domain-containing protein [Paenibacillus sp. GCM10023252]|uniref:IDEAL domain-containing protein n=1 Tax=Paenibacillus sp. GCM10023252 TaxID=3252649 RepID=UPI003609D0F7
MDKMKVTYEAMLGLTAEMVLDEAVLKFRTDKIYHAIDRALAAGDEDSFHRLASELNVIKSDGLYRTSSS